jgi:hypothetical protein
MGAPIHGKNGLIYVSGTEVVGANAWTISIDADSAEASSFGATWKTMLAGLVGWSGSITSWDQTDDKILQDSAAAGATVALLIYPTKNTLTTYYSGSAIFSAGGEGSNASGVSVSASFVGTGTLTCQGFT